MSFTILDIIIFAILTASTTLGIYRGFTKVVVGSIAFIFSIFTAYYLYPHTKEFLGKHISNESMLAILSCAISYLITFAFFSFLNSKFCEIIKSLFEGALDKFLGLFAGFARGSIISIILYIIIIIISSKSYVNSVTAEDVYIKAINCEHPNWLINSLTFDTLDKATKTLVDMLPEESLRSIKLPFRKSNKDSLDSFKKNNLDDQEESPNIDELDEELDNI
jgi:uncharacterized membrane protein required for colicin V production